MTRKSESGKDDTPKKYTEQDIEVLDGADEEEEEESLDLDEDVIDLDEDETDDFILDASLPAVSGSSVPGKSATRDSLHLYLREISKFPLLKPDEEFQLARKVLDEGDQDAAFRLVSSHLRLVVKIAMDFQRRWMQNVLDLVQEGNVGLMRAVHKFDPDKGIKFSYYASFWIKAYILKFIMDNWRLVKIGTTQAQRKLFYNLNKERQRLMAQGFVPDSAMLSERLNVSEEQIIEMEQRLDASDMSLDLPVGEDGSTATRMDFLPALGPGVEDMLANSELGTMLKEHIKTIEPKLNDKELEILHGRLLSEDPITLREIGEKYNITRERVRQIEARLLQKLRDHLFREIKDFSKDWINR
ncbi:RNA polymerase factor sigma-32 [Desulfovibrio subterraneus]|jgi:RNA polymerase sigma-32 factor|uniref:RNA polymerase sigma factor n=1 Tax=Desulfovibrio subterraneus TaxID=2718620 RepID=A0A7J0BKE2_9BACT|nr:RNA polymerase factor sigma-32 [Desulfovibrio subterraneus]WBF68204.1 RNA polymerase factor sigma-32 [Desulfovibrio subterraneus]GFM34150.1 RNA polymerase sigma factor [Desulfovibrio subterraneus]